MATDPYVNKYDASFRKEHKGNTHFVKIGVAFACESGRIDIKLDALPVGEWNGQLSLFPQIER